MKSIVIYNITREIDKYTPAFMDKVNYIVDENEHKDGDTYLGKRIRDYDWLLKQEKVFIFVSNVVNKSKAINRLSRDGYKKGQDFVWAPEWYGDKLLPPCYPLRSWEDNECKYDFSGQAGPWDHRYKELLTLMPEDARSVMDCGAGNMSLKRYLDDEILYYPIDKTKKYPETNVCDFNSGSFPDIYSDVAFLCGILEYISCPEIFLRKLCQHSKTVLIAYCSLHMCPEISVRMLNGWKNHFTTGELVKIFGGNGYYLFDEIYEEKGGIYLRFDKKGAW